MSYLIRDVAIVVGLAVGAQAINQWCAPCLQNGLGEGGGSHLGTSHDCPLEILVSGGITMSKHQMPLQSCIFTTGAAFGSAFANSLLMLGKL